MTEQTTPQAEPVYTGIIAEYSPVDAAIAELRSRYADVLFPVETKQGMEDAKDVRRKLVKLRTGLETLRKEIKEPALRRTQAIDAEAKAITAAIRAIEEPIDAQIKAEEQRIEAEKAAKAKREAEIKEKIEGIRSLATAVANCTSDEIAAEREALSSFVPTQEVFGEHLDDCKAALNEADAALADLYDKVLAREQAAAALIAEQAKLEAERRAFEAEKAAYEAERRAFEERKAAEAVTAAISGAESEPAELGTLTANGAEAWKDVPDATAYVEEIRGNDDLGTSEAAPVSDFHTRSLALATAAQFYALAYKVRAVGFAAYAKDLIDVGNLLRSGQHDLALMAANKNAILAADTDLIEATAQAIETLTQREAA